MEWLACQDAILLAKNKGFRNVILEGDSLTIINALNGKEALTSVANIIQDIKDISLSCTRILFSFVRRPCNKAALVLAAKTVRDPSFSCNPWQQFDFVFSSLPT